MMASTPVTGVNRITGRAVLSHRAWWFACELNSLGSRHRDRVYAQEDGLAGSQMELSIRRASPDDIARARAPPMEATLRRWPLLTNLAQNLSTHGRSSTSRLHALRGCFRTAM
jgi:hypothetical protein